MHLSAYPCFNRYRLIFFSDPARQFDLVREHIAKIRQRIAWMDSHVKIYVERNLGFESEHHARDLGGIPGVIFHQVMVVY